MTHDILMVFVATFFAYILRFGFGDAITQVQHMASLLMFFLPLQVICNLYFGVHRGIWRFVSLPDLIRIIKSAFIATSVAVSCLFFFLRLESIPRTIFPLYLSLLIGLTIFSRIVYRYWLEKKHHINYKRNVLIVGAGNAGELLLRDIKMSANHDYKVIGFIDDSYIKQGKEIHGVRVLGKIREIPKIVVRYNVKLIFIAIPSASSEQMLEVVNYCNIAKVKFKTLPSLNEMAKETVSVSELRDVNLEDLLGREEIAFDVNLISQFITNKTVVITGGGGSIGSAICRKIALLQPKKLVVIDSSELNIFNLTQEMNDKFPSLNFTTFLASVTDKFYMDKIFNAMKPNIVFHTAAYKHVPILESQIYSAVYNNIFGTQVIADTAIKYDVEKVVLISTDKAVNPSNVMGKTKRIAELICQHKNNLLSKHLSKTQFIIVRFGNVLGSSGSVIPIFTNQILSGGPVTVTHKDMTRFFMTIPEAASLIIQASCLGIGGEIFVLDMGKPMSINYLAEQLIKLYGKEPHIDIKIKYSGLRAGEKMYEELFYKHEEIELTANKKIFLSHAQQVNSESIQKIEEFIHKLQSYNIEDIENVEEILTQKFLTLYQLL